MTSARMSVASSSRPCKERSTSELPGLSRCNSAAPGACAKIRTKRPPLNAARTSPECHSSPGCLTIFSTTSWLSRLPALSTSRVPKAITELCVSRVSAPASRPGALEFHSSVLLIEGDGELTQDFEANVCIPQGGKRNCRLRIVKATNVNRGSQLRLLEFDLITD